MVHIVPPGCWLPRIWGKYGSACSCDGRAVTKTAAAAAVLAEQMPRSGSLLPLRADTRIPKRCPRKEMYVKIIVRSLEMEDPSLICGAEPAVPSLLPELNKIEIQ